MTDKKLEAERTRRTFVKTTAAVGATAAGAGTLASGAAGQQTDAFDIGDVTIVDADGALIDIEVTLTDVNVDIIDNVDVRVRDVLQNFTIDVVDVDQLTLTVQDVQIANANNVVVLVQALSEGDNVLETERQVVRQVGRQ